MICKKLIEIIYIFIFIHFLFFSRENHIFLPVMRPCSRGATGVISFSRKPDKTLVVT